MGTAREERAFAHPTISRLRLVGTFLPGRFEQEPGPPLGLVDEIFQKAGAGNIAGLVADLVRLAHRDGKPNYLGWMDRTWAIVEENLAHPALSDLRRWFDHHLPADLRRRAIDPVRLVTTE